ncbi:hypothetical protein B0T22DRAFT_190410 [Podospora appendiculata]|uniref:Uncharacterized protein n=1 Tax=Podospora appendiculata TaxID=314037 RepID=A0AAE0XD19_9PEZI|nr:hypothetical protein B0T22DRAFT_190410 [Podospora appendiculata]
MATHFVGAGYNPIHGRDTGPPPPRNGPRPNCAHYPGAGFPVTGFPAPAPAPAPAPTTYPYIAGYPAPANYGGYSYMIQHPPAIGTTFATTQVNQRPYQYTSGLHGSNRLPQAYPRVDPTMPAVNMNNSTGGVGCEPGYNYFFPPEHTKIHVLKCGARPPWEHRPNAVFEFHACHVPVNTTVAELMAGFGATNPEKKRNVITEVVQGGGGRWYRGIILMGNDKDAMKRTCKEMGWDASRTGLPGQKPVVYLYITK